MVKDGHQKWKIVTSKIENSHHIYIWRIITTKLMITTKERDITQTEADVDVEIMV